MKKNNMLPKLAIFVALCFFFGVGEVSATIDISGTWVEEGSGVVDTYYGSGLFVTKREMVLVQSGNEITGSIFFTLELSGCCGPIESRRSLIGTITNENTVNIVITIETYETCRCESTTDSDDIKIGTGREDWIGDTYERSFILSSDGKFLNREAPSCILQWSGECVAESNGFAKQDCAGAAGGSAYIDYCGNCVGGSTGLSPCSQDCAGVYGGDAFIDDCGNCVGGETDLSPCISENSDSGDGGGGCFIIECMENQLDP